MLKRISTFYLNLEENHPSAMGRFHAFLNAISNSLISCFIKKAKNLNEFEMNYVRCLIAFFFFYNIMSSRRNEIWPKGDSDQKTTLLVRGFIAGAGGVILSYSATILNIQLLVVIFSLATPLTVFYEKILFGIDEGFFTWLCTFLSFIGVIISVNPDILVHGLKAFPNSKEFIIYLI